ncbi:cytochrome P450 [Lindgomyces ingoldianus]|uniref:Cytochrome P450 n=1 Tax=Lindgomyces ingoldianus TaxID=673940 RepID=A0ACB6QGS7_9PLEO|nr:cytochrome P450 [Lindgomyces ingoldianus]KAF2465350.1 cytochrome P450 [Lindgomyces ingoldianus]
MAILNLPLTSTSNLVLWCSVVIALNFLLLSIYRVYLHPLSKFPGPIRYKLSGWPLLWQAYKGNRHLFHLKDHEKYGPIVRISPSTLSFNTAPSLATIYGSRTVPVKKGEWYKTFDVAAGTYSSFTETDKAIHATKRRWVSPAFSDLSQRANETLIIDVIERFCETIRPRRREGGDKGGWGEKWNASVLTTYLGFDIMGALVFGCDFRTVQEVGYRDLADSILPASKFLYWVSYLPLAPLVRPLLRTKLFEILGGRPIRDNNRLIEYASAQVGARARGTRNESGDWSGKVNKNGNDEEADTERIDFLSHLINKPDQKSGWRPTRADLDTECLNMMNAGADPFSSVLAGAIFYLVHNPTALQKATAEVRSTFTSPNDIHSGPLLTSCLYLSACIEETLRLCSPVPSHLPRTILPPGLTIPPYPLPLPPGTVVGVPCYSIHHNPVYFPSPFSFLPSRWIESPSNPPSAIEAAKSAFEPFGIGSRACIGKNIAYLQLRLTLAHVLWRFDLREISDVGCIGVWEGWADG